jgi:hypothetical protein
MIPFDVTTDEFENDVDRENAWGEDQIAPLSGGSSNHYNGWGATIVDTL